MAEYYHTDDTDINLYDPETNIKYTCMYIHYLTNKFKETKIVLASYNAGETVVRRWLSFDPELNNIPYEETRKYIDKIYKDLKFYSKVY